MIIFNDLTWQICSDYPDTDYTPEKSALYVIPDSSPLVSIVMQYAPNIKIIVDEEGNVVNIIGYEDIKAIKNYKCQEINNACSNIIYQGIDYNGEHYDLTDEDQINILAWSSIAQLGNSVPYHSSGNPCRIYSAEEFLGLVNAATQFKTYNLSYCNLLKQQISEMTDADEVKNIKYGDNLNEKYQNMLNQLLGGQNETNS